MHIDHADSRDYSELEDLKALDERLRQAIYASLMNDLPQLAVALDTARTFVEDVLGSEQPTSSRIAMARSRAEIALQVWNDAVGAVLAHAS